jgi:beta-alanine--pyruvate transaminase
VTADTSQSLSAYWMPFTANRQFKSAPRLLAKAEGMFYKDVNGRDILDATSGLWCVNAGHCRKEIAEAISRQARELDYAPSFQMSHPGPFQFAQELTRYTPEGLDRVFFTNSGSEAVDSALKIALAYHRARFIGEERAYHGVGFGGTSVGGIGSNRRQFGAWLPADHLPSTLNFEHNAFSRGEPGWGAHLAQNLEGILALHHPSTIAAVIVEPVNGSAGVIVHPKGYLKKLREICDRHGILLIFDEVITGFGRLGTPFASHFFGVKPDLMTCAKAITNAAVPMGAVFAASGLYEAITQGPEHLIEFAHGYTFSGHPLACAAGRAALEIYVRENLFSRAAEIGSYFEDAAHSLRDLSIVKDVRNLGLMAGIELHSAPDGAGRRGYEALVGAFERGVLIRVTGDIIALSPPLIVEKNHIDQMFGVLGQVLRGVK